MNDAGSPLHPPGLAPASGSNARFTGSMPAFRRLIIRGAFLQVVTLGIYRFWLLTDIRRFLWANTEVGGESAEYTGTAMELLLGFLIAIALLVPIFVLIALGALSLGPLGQLSGLVGYVILGIFGQYAYFRARRYRLTRTVFRGVRLHQSGSAWRYAFRSILWWILIALTVGLAYPFAQASLERYKLKCTFYGDLQGSFVGRGWSLFLRGVLMWLIVLAPAVAGFVYAAMTVDWPSIAAAIQAGAGRDLPRVLESNAAFKIALGLFGGAFGWLMLAAVFLYPAFQAMVLRWWLNGLRFGDVTVSSRLRTGRVYGAYLRYMGWTMLIMIGAIAVFVVVAIVGTLAFKSSGIDKDTLGGVAAVLGVVAYILLAFCAWIVYQVAVKLRLWRITVDSVAIAGFDAVERVRADNTQLGTAVGEGLIDALGAGGM
jgi:uncharacterized membrane protein YjgN (DUF898 family)